VVLLSFVGPAKIWVMVIARGLAKIESSGAIWAEAAKEVAQSKKPKIRLRMGGLLEESGVNFAVVFISEKRTKRKK
jgi:hypothetical protein